MEILGIWPIVLVKMVILFWDFWEAVGSRSKLVFPKLSCHSLEQSGSFFFLQSFFFSQVISFFRIQTFVVYLLVLSVVWLAWASWVSWELLCFDLVFGVSLRSSDSRVLWCIDDISSLRISAQLLFNLINPDFPLIFFSSVVGKKAKKNKWKTLDPTLIINTSALPVKPLSWAEESEIEGKRVCIIFTFRVLGIFFFFFHHEENSIQKKLLN